MAAQPLRDVGPDLVVTFESCPGGRIYERTPDGSDDWGDVLAWEPLHRLAYLWHLGTDRSRATEVDISFVGDDTTTVTHRGWERLGADGLAWRQRNLGGQGRPAAPLPRCGRLLCGGGQDLGGVDQGRRSPARPGSAGGAGRTRCRWCRAADHRVERARPPSALGRSVAEALGFSSWALPKVPETWMATLASGRSMEKRPTLDTTSSAELCPEGGEQLLALLHGVSPVITGRPAARPGSERRGTGRSRAPGRPGGPRPGWPPLVLGGGGGHLGDSGSSGSARVVHPLLVGQVDPDLDAVGCRHQPWASRSRQGTS